ncbi:MAG TPA: putative Ig domain-containing protein [Chthoniobacteraceae bacterium]|nr:putative Ig domain-containing protein [Chthoniobacteraceae bacterium]
MSGTLDDGAGEEFAAKVRQGVTRGAKLVVDGSGLTALDPQGVVHLVNVQRWTGTEERKRLVLAGFNAAVWRSIVDNGFDFVFDSKPTLADALKVYGVVAAPLVAPPLPSTGPVPRERVVAQDTVWTTPIDKPPPKTGGTLPPPPPLTQPSPPMGKGPWETYEPPTRPNAGSKGSGSSRKLLLFGGAGAAVLLLGGLLWWLLASRAPTLEVSPKSIEAEEGGAEVEGVKVTIAHGQLRDTDGLPAGLHFEPINEDSTEAYALRGSVAPGAHTATVELLAESSDHRKKSSPVSFEVVVKPKPVTWQLSSLQSLSLRVGLPVSGYAKIVTGVSDAPTAKGLPPGLQIEQVPGSPRDWRLAGTPTKEGEFPVTFAVRSGDTREEKAVTLKVEKAPGFNWQVTNLSSLKLRVGEPVNTGSKFLTGASKAPTATGLPPGLTIQSVQGSPQDWQLAGTPTQAGKYHVTFSALNGELREEQSIDLTVEPKTDGQVPPPPPPPPDSQEGLRTFLLERIEKLPSKSYTPEQREQLRVMVNHLTEARLIHKVVFPSGKSEVSKVEAKKIIDALNDPDNDALLKKPNCKVVIVGYASPEGRMADNVWVSKKRARAVEIVVKGKIKHNADFCGDYGPTDAADFKGDRNNRAAEIYAGIVDIPPDLQLTAEKFMRDLREQHGAR